MFGGSDFFGSRTTAGRNTRRSAVDRSVTVLSVPSDRADDDADDRENDDQSDTDAARGETDRWDAIFDEDTGEDVSVDGNAFT